VGRDQLVPGQAVGRTEVDLDEVWLDPNRRAQRPGDRTGRVEGTTERARQDDRARGRPPSQIGGDLRDLRGDLHRDPVRGGPASLCQLRVESAAPSPAGPLGWRVADEPDPPGDGHHPPVKGSAMARPATMSHASSLRATRR
jgi:hypothetical protein